MIRDNAPITEYLYNKASSLRLSVSGTFELTPVCNFACSMCYVRQTQQEVDRATRSILTLEDWLSIARQAREEGLLYLLLTGGEPLLWPRFWELYDALVDMGLLVSINTNGSLIDERAIARFRQKPPHRVNITLYGRNDETYHCLCGVRGVYTKVDRAICSLQAAGIAVKLNCSLTPRNAHDLEAVAAYARERGLPLSVATYMFPPVRRDAHMVGENDRFTPEEAAEHQLRWLRLSRGEKDFRQYLRSVLEGSVPPPGLEESCVDPVDGHIRCRAGNASFWITWDGWMLPCGMMPQPRVDIKKENFSRCWEALAESSAALRLSGVCDKCPDRGLCHPCGAISYGETGCASGIPTYMCRATNHLRKLAGQLLAQEET